MIRLTRTSLLIVFAILTVLSFALPSMPGMPKEWAEYWEKLLKVIDGALIWLAANRNQDGTPSSVAYRKPE